MRRWLPFPLVSLFLLVMWLLLNQSLAPAHVLAGGLLAFYGPRLLVRLDAPRGGPRRALVALHLVGIVIYDIIRSNIAVSRIILGGRQRDQTSGFLRIPLRLSNENALAALATIVTSTPGTLWVDYDATKGVLLLHVLDLVDENEWIELIKYRYERLLMEIFE